MEAIITKLRIYYDVWPSVEMYQASSSKAKQKIVCLSSTTFSGRGRSVECFLSFLVFHTKSRSIGRENFLKKYFRSYEISVDRSGKLFTF